MECLLRFIVHNNICLFSFRPLIILYSLDCQINLFSKSYLNLENVIESALHRRVDTIDFSGTVLCEQMKYLDLDKRGFSMIAHVSINEIIDISDILQGIFEYV